MRRYASSRPDFAPSRPPTPQNDDSDSSLLLTEFSNSDLDLILSDTDNEYAENEESSSEHEEDGDDSGIEATSEESTNPLSGGPQKFAILKREALEVLRKRIDLALFEIWRLNEIVRGLKYTIDTIP